MSVAAPAVQAGLGLVKTVDSFIKEGQAKKIAKQLELSRPKLGRDALTDENLAFAKSELANGMSARAERAYTDLNDSQFSNSLSAILKGGGNLNSIGDIYGNNQEGRLKLALMQDQLRTNQINQKVNASKAVSDRNDQMFLYNEDAPWKDKAQANANALQGAENGIWQGLNTVGSAAMQFGQDKKEENQFNSKMDYYNKLLGTTPTAPTAPTNNSNNGGGFIDPSEIVWS